MRVYLFIALTFLHSRCSAIRVDSIPLDELLNGHPSTEQPITKWTGRYFPTPPKLVSTTPPSVRHGGVPMGFNANCDDAKTNLTVDWDFSPRNYTCYNPNQRFMPDRNISPLLTIESLPKLYSAVHYCMNETITYHDPFPTFGPHRPAWPRYGEYRFVPVQRWLHTLEHGGVVMLYHPCAHPVEIGRLRRLVKACLFRHVITPNTMLSAQRPLALITWGEKLTMSVVNTGIVKDFIKQNALRGPEAVSRDGQYDTELLEPAAIVSDTQDSDLCPQESLSTNFW